MTKAGVCAALGCAVLLAAVSARAGEGEPVLTVPEILARVDAAEAPPRSRGRFRQVITTTRGGKRTLEMESYSRDGTDKQLIRYTAPARVEGESLLMLDDGDEIWYFSPRTDRVRKIASHARKKKVMGSDFSYEDMSGGNMAEDYTGVLLGEEPVDGRACLHLALTPTPSGPSYGKIEAWVDAETYLTVRVDYWNEHGERFKRLTAAGVETIDGRPTITRFRMHNLKTGGETLMEVLAMSYTEDVPASWFTVRHLKRR